MGVEAVMASSAGGSGRDLRVLEAAWQLYFTKEEGEFSAFDGRVKVVQLFARFFRGEGASLIKVIWSLVGVCCT